MSGLTKFLKKMDLFRRIDESYLSSATFHGGSLTLVAYIAMAILAILEFSSYLRSTTTSTVVMDVNQDESILVTFNVTMLDLPCKFLAVDVYDSFGWERQNVTANIEKTRLHIIGNKYVDGDTHDVDEVKVVNEEGAERNKKPIELDEEGHHALDLKGKDGFVEELKTHEYTFMNFYAPWCSHCQVLAPTWEKAALAFDELDYPNKKGVMAKMASINCDKYSQLCREHRIRAYPTVAVYRYNQLVQPVYRGDRTVSALVAFFTNAIDKGHKSLPTMGLDRGCRVAGWFEVPRVPGNFHIEARSENHDLAPAMSNLSHIVNHLQFGESLDPRLEYKLPYKHQRMMRPLDGREFLLETIHAAPQHYIKVVTTMYEFDSKTVIPSYQMTTQNRIATYDEDEIPEAKFSYDMSPVSVIVSQKGKPLYEFLTSLFAIVGGTFTVLSIVDGAVDTVNTRLKNTLGKMS